ncbi:MAG: UDP-N-acetylmuramate--alanine ligase [Fibrobacteres bacterium]|nr:UDP-N-acetylmuramate--alanine ligase [Fibrobacterota bacterium]
MRSRGLRRLNPRSFPIHLFLPEAHLDLTHPFFSGIAGTGMSALAQYLAFQGTPVSGSDRSLDRGAEADKRAYFERIGITLAPQDGSGLDGCSCLVISTAIEAQNPEVRRAGTLNLPIIHRSDLLAELARRRKTIAISGTSGKSTVTGMAYHVLEAGGLQPSLITGANLGTLVSEGLLGNAKAGAGEWLLIEADESDGSLIKYSPELGVILNVEKDHKEVEELIPLFERFRDQTARRVILNGDDAHCAALARPGDLLFHPASVADGAARDIRLGDWDTRFTMAGTAFRIRVPGRHNLANAMAALAIGRELGISLADCARGLENYRGVERRHVHVGDTGGVTVVDDFAHNPAKVKACLETVKAAADGSKRRVLAIFHPHGFAPMKLMGRELVEGIVSALDASDVIFMPEIYYAGGTADKSISSADLIREANAAKPVADAKQGAGFGRFYSTKDEVIAAVAKEARPGDWIVSMGARDPSLGGFAQKLFAAVQARFPAR